MINSNHISQLLTSPWAISNGAMEAFLISAAAQQQNKIKAEMPTPFRMNAKGEIGNGSSKEVLMIPIEGITVKYDLPEAGLMGYKTIQNLINQINADSTLVGGIIYHESPGGTVMDLAETADIIKASKKPIVSFIEMSCSASYYLAAPSDYIIATLRSAMIGNIGTRTSPMDLRGILGKMGAKYADVFGTLAFDKDLGYADALDGKPEKMQAMIINPHNEMFVNDVKRYRPQINEDATHGAVYLSEEAISMGLIDQVGSLQDAISKVFELSKTKSKTQLNSQNNSKSMSNIFKTVVAALGFSVAAKTDNTEPTEEDYANALATGISQKITGFENELNSLKDAKPQGITEEALTEKLKNFVSAETFNALKSEHDKEVEAHKATATALTALQSKVPGASASSPVAGEDESKTITGFKTPVSFD